MAEYIVQDTSLTPIADEIRALSGVSDKLSLSAMAKNTKDANSEVDTQTDLLAQVLEALSGKAGGGLPDGFSALTSGTITPASAIDISSFEVQHGFGVTPNFMMIIAGSGFDATINDNVYLGYFIFNSYQHSSRGNVVGVGMVFGSYSQQMSSYPISVYEPTDASWVPFNTESASFPMQGIPLTAGVTYLWILGVADNLT